MKKILLITTTTTISFIGNLYAMEAGQMYIKGDLGYQFSQLKYIEFDNSKRIKGPTQSIGIGGMFTDKIRADITFNFQNNKATLTEDNTDDIIYGDKDHIIGNKGVSSKFRRRGIAVMANTYYDLTNKSPVTPYIMGGIGISRDNIKVSYSGKDINDKSKIITLISKNKTSFAYQVGVGVGYEFNKNLRMDLGYRLHNHGGKNRMYVDKDFTTENNTVNKGTEYEMSNASRAWQQAITLGFIVSF